MVQKNGPKRCLVRFIVVFFDFWADISLLCQQFNFINVHDDEIDGSGDQKITNMAQGVTWDVGDVKPSLLTASRSLSLAFVIVPETQVITLVERRFPTGRNF
jgi:hypothetical protein